MDNNVIDFKGTLSSTDDLPGARENNKVGDAYQVGKVLFVWEGECWRSSDVVHSFKKSNLEELVDYKRAIDLDELIVPTSHNDLHAETTVHGETIEDIVRRDQFAKEHKPYIDQVRKSATIMAVDKLLRNGHLGKYGKSVGIEMLPTIPDSDVKVIDLDIPKLPEVDSQVTHSSVSPIKNTPGLFHLKDPDTGALVSGGIYPTLGKKIGFRLVNDVARDRIYGRGYLFTGIVINMRTLIRIASLEPSMRRWGSMYPPAPPMVTVKDIAYYWYIEDGK